MRNMRYSSQVTVIQWNIWKKLIFNSYVREKKLFSLNNSYQGEK